jgi:hypothetical protein
MLMAICALVAVALISAPRSAGWRGADRQDQQNWLHGG